ncbi:MAG: hypothetical protein K9M36_01115 [Candidatus Pacebacteria bacterium]|nr:hypothetical protein [Candidatus Paceibacterota bacterium]
MDNEKDAQSSLKKAKFFIPTSFDETQEYNPLFDVNNTIEPSRIVNKQDEELVNAEQEDVGGISFSVPQGEDAVTPEEDKESVVDVTMLEHASDPALVDVLRAGDTVATEHPEFADALHAEKVSFEDYERERQKDPLRDPTLMPKKDSAMRTYFSDVQHVTTTSDPTTIATVFDTVHEEEQQKKQDAKFTTKNIFYGIGSFLFFAGAIFIVMFFVLPKFTNINLLQQNNQAGAPTLLPSDDYAVISFPVGIALLDSATKIKEVLSSAYTFNSVIALHPVIPEGLGSRPLTSKQFLETLQIKAPLGFLGTLEESPFMYGIFSGAQNYPFMVLRVSTYDNAFSGMQIWEDTLIADVKNLFGLPPDALRMTYERAPFENVLWKNRNIRRAQFNTALVSRETDAIPRTFENTRLESFAISDILIWYPETILLQGTYMPVVETQEDSEISLDGDGVESDIGLESNSESENTTEEPITTEEVIEETTEEVSVQDDGVIVGVVLEEEISAPIIFPLLFTTPSGDDLIIDRSNSCPLLPDSVVEQSLQGLSAATYRVNACARIGEEDVLVAQTNSTDEMVVRFLESLDQYVEKIILDTESQFVPTYDEQETVLLYTFLNENTLLITTHESVLEEAIRRMARSTFLQFR